MQKQTPNKALVRTQTTLRFVWAAQLGRQAVMNYIYCMWTYLQNNWEMLVAFFTAAGGAIAFFDMRRRELAWKRTEFIFEQAKYLDSDPQIANAVSLLAGTENKLSVCEIFGATADLTNSEVSSYRTSFDKLFNVLDWFAYATFDAKTVKLAEVANFGWYLRQILNEKVIVDYCMNTGFGDTIKLAREVVAYNEERERSGS